MHVLLPIIDSSSSLSKYNNVLIFRMFKLEYWKLWTWNQCIRLNYLLLSISWKFRFLMIRERLLFSKSCILFQWWLQYCVLYQYTRRTKILIWTYLDSVCEICCVVEIYKLKWYCFSWQWSSIVCCFAELAW